MNPAFESENICAVIILTISAVQFGVSISEDRAQRDIDTPARFLDTLARFPHIPARILWGGCKIDIHHQNQPSFIQIQHYNGNARTQKSPKLGLFA